MSYEVIVERRARLPSTVYDRTMRAVNELANDLRPRQSLSLQGRSGRRLRVGDYRVLYEVDDDRGRVFVAEVRHRQKDYR